MQLVLSGTFTKPHAPLDVLQVLVWHAVLLLVLQATDWLAVQTPDWQEAANTHLLLALAVAVQFVPSG